MGFIDIIINKKIAEGKQIGDLSPYLVPHIDPQLKTAVGALTMITHDNTSNKYQILISCALTNNTRAGRWANSFHPKGTAATSAQAGIFNTVTQSAANDSADPFHNLKEPIVLAPSAGVGFTNTDSQAADLVGMYLIYLEVEI